jgi:DNA polymerase-3 subunit gamma/tau
MGQALYRKYRPHSLKDVASQEHIVQTLSNALKTNQISHAYLFTGPRGVGKTSVARIFAHAINGIVYDDDAPNMDIIEIDAASNRRIDEIRELRERVYITPTAAKYKVYIIDEVHMLTREAFNALLKTLEEPPAHVVFILATTEVQKLPETIISRTQRFSFRPISDAESIKLLEHVAEEEQIDVSKDALKLLAEHSGGSLRDGLSLLDQASSRGGSINEKTVSELLGLPPKQSLEHLIELISADGSSAALMDSLSRLYDQGFQAATLAAQIAQIIRESLIANTIDKTMALKLLQNLIEVPASASPDRLLEIVLLESQPQVSAPAQKQASKLSTPAQTEKKPLTPKQAATIDADPTEAAQLEEETATTAKELIPFDNDLWQTVLDSIKKKYNTLYGIIKMAQPYFKEDDTLELVFAFEFHKKKLSEANNKQILSDIISKLTGKPIFIECSWDKNAKPPKSPQLKVDKPVNDISTVNSIFNGAELLES